MRVLIVDDHPIARQGLATLVRQAFRVERIIEAETAHEAIVAAKRDDPELILLDLGIPGVESTSVLCTQLRIASPRARVAIITAFDEANAIKRCFAAGADACLLKDSSMIDLRKALQAVVAGQRVIDPRIAQTLATEHVRVLRGERPTVALTQREREILERLAEGCSNRPIAERLFIAETTVKGYVSSLLDKLEASSRLQAVVRATEHGHAVNPWRANASGRERAHPSLCRAFVGRSGVNDALSGTPPRRDPGAEIGEEWLRLVVRGWCRTSV